VKSASVELFKVLSPLGRKKGAWREQLLKELTSSGIHTEAAPVAMVKRKLAGYPVEREEPS
jgi:hypothetical protein